jgi:adenosylcobinamide-GDP ribazoletransferase
VTTSRALFASRQGSRALAELAAAIKFLTRLPMRRATADPGRTGAAAFAVVGAAIGLVGAIPVVLLGSRLPLPAAALALLVVTLVSGGLHLDGLGDTADALAAPAPDAAELARADPRAGAAGVAAITLDLLLGASLLAAIAGVDPRLAAAALVVASTGSRAAAPIAAWVARIRGEGRQVGLGGWFTASVKPADVGAAIATAVVVAVVASIVADRGALWLGAGAGLIVAALLSVAIVRRRRQLDGDGYGAIVEITFLSVLAGIAVGVPVS